MAVFSSAGLPPCELWDFAIKLYNEKHVSDACLALQDRLGIDVNLLLFCNWVAASGREGLSRQEVEEAINASAQWQSNVVLPLRSLRRYLKSPKDQIDARLAGDLRRVVADSELYSERLELQMLGKLTHRPATSSFAGQECADAAADNLLLYMSRLTGELSERDRKDILIIWQAAFPAARPEKSPLAAVQTELAFKV